MASKAVAQSGHRPSRSFRRAKKPAGFDVDTAVEKIMDTAMHAPGR